MIIPAVDENPQGITKCGNKKWLKFIFVEQVQQQPNFSDCGIYLLQYVESFFKSPILDYTLPITSLKSWFPEEEVRYSNTPGPDLMNLS